MFDFSLLLDIIQKLPVVAVWTAKLLSVFVHKYGTLQDSLYVSFKVFLIIDPDSFRW